MSGGSWSGLEPGAAGPPAQGGDIARFLEDVEASSVRPGHRPGTPSLSASSGGSRGCTPPPAWDPRPPVWDPPPAGSSRSASPSSRSLARCRSSGSGGKVRRSPVTADSSLNTSSSSAGQQLRPPGPQPALQRVPSAPSLSSYGGGSTGGKTKKKSWMSSALHPTYRSRSDELRRNFPGLPGDEMLMVDYSCALQRDILVHGRLYVTPSSLCFYANIFRWETAVTIRWREVTELRKEKTALVIPNAVQVCAGQDKFFFTSFAARDKTYIMLFRLWQNALLDSPASQPELWAWVGAVYGEQAGRYNSDDPDASNDGASNYSYDGLELSGTASLPLTTNSQRPRLFSNIEEDEEENKLQGSKGPFLPGTEGEHAPAPARPPDPLADTLTYEAWRQAKDAREIVSRNFSLNIDDLFTLLFTNSKFFYDFQAERRTSDILQCEWQHSDRSEDKFREVSYTMALNHAIGPKTTRATEVQTMRANSVPGHIYNVDVETTNADIPYADHFYVSTHYCIVRVGEAESLLTVLCDIKYKKTPWGLVKTFIEKNCWAGIEEHYCALAGGLEREAEAYRQEESPEKSKKLTRRQRNQRRASVGGEGSERGGGPGPCVPAPLLQGGAGRGRGQLQGRGQPGAGRGGGPLPGGAALLAGLLVLLCGLNIYLVWRLWALEGRLAHTQEEPWLAPAQEAPGGGPAVPGGWLQVLREQEGLHHRDLQAWRRAVEAAAGLLRQTESTMVKLTQAVEGEPTGKEL